MLNVTGQEYFLKDNRHFKKIYKEKMSLHYFVFYVD